jgi:hypothetical protein
MDPGSAAHHAASHSASKTRVNALMALRSIRGTNGARSATREVASSFRVDLAHDRIKILGRRR